MLGAGSGGPDGRALAPARSHPAFPTRSKVGKRAMSFWGACRDFFSRPTFACRYDMHLRLIETPAFPLRMRRRERTPPPARRKAEVETSSGKHYEVQERPRRKDKAQVEAAERRRSKDTFIENVASSVGGAKAGRPPKGESGPRPGSSRFIAKATGSLVSHATLAKASKQLAAEGGVRDGRKHNRREANLSPNRRHAAPAVPQARCSA